ncbi:exosortase-associated EpsI family protein [Thalassoroseus pseudoceratinae]|uniref:exosortase-associated EpsI family protein n=1 Tax=Thalassoroseus pseudoceratinae TaxID=2713176 RepID=UPI0014234B27|nr:exosortase-associated EpsI family protein [Thalassoroseus pseudoceratinae]
MIKIIIPLLIFVLLIASRFLHAIQTEQSRNPHQLEKATERIADVPLEFGEWSSTELELTPRQLRMAEATGGLARRFQRDGGTDGNSVVDILLLCGPHGPISLHPPTVCFRGAGYEQCAEVQSSKIPTSNQSIERDTFWVTQFDKPSAGGVQRIQTYWAWSDGNQFVAADNPRLSYAGSPFLYKLYVTQYVDEKKPEGDQSKVGQEFLIDFLPHLKSALGS